MVAHREQIDSLNTLLKLIRLRNSNSTATGSRQEKIEQIISYLDVIDAHIRKISTKKKLVFVDSAAGNCYLSFLAYHYYRNICNRDIEIHCIDVNQRLMSNSEKNAHELGFREMYFHHCDILDFSCSRTVDVSYSLHACDTATDKALFLGLLLQASCLLSVSCCQHSVRNSFKNHAVKGVTRYKAFKDRLLYIVADTMRAHLLAQEGYRVDIFDFTSSRYTEKNIMIRARKAAQRVDENLTIEYDRLKQGFSMEPELARLIKSIALEGDQCRIYQRKKPKT